MAPARREGRFPWFLATGALIGGLAIAVFLGLAWIDRVLETPRSFSAPPSGLLFELPRGEPTSKTVARLHAAGLLDRPRLVLLEQVYRHGDPPFQAGLYRFEPPLSPRQILGKLREGRVALESVTLVEGLTLHETAAALAEAGFSSREALLAAFHDPSPIRDLDTEARNLEGYLFPETYSFPRTVSASEIARTLTREFRLRFEREIRPLLSESRPTSVRQLVILASLVEKEAQTEEERPLVAAVYANRIARGMGLYADPTVIYGLKLEGRWDGNLRRIHLEEDSPWNSYRRPGWPPGPIASPGLASLRAAARPAQVDYLYFVSRNDGTHAFSRTLAEHSRNVDRWQRRGRAD